MNSPTGLPAPFSADRTADRVALVTGAARGIGAATVRALSDSGYRVIALDSCAGSEGNPPANVPYPLASRASLQALAQEHPDAVLPFLADVRDRGALAAAVSLAVDRFGRLDAVVAAAGVVVGGQAVWQMRPEDLLTLWEVDVLGVWNTASVSIPVMLTSPHVAACRFVAVASVAGTTGLYHLGGYTMAKHAVVGLIRGLAADLRNTGLAAVAVCPGSTETEGLRAAAALYGLSGEGEFAQAQLLGRLLTPEEVASVLAFCCSPAGGVLNGSVVRADGGFQG